MVSILMRERCVGQVDGIGMCDGIGGAAREKTQGSSSAHGDCPCSERGVSRYCSGSDDAEFALVNESTTAICRARIAGKRYQSTAIFHQSHCARSIVDEGGVNGDGIGTVVGDIERARCIGGGSTRAEKAFVDS